MIPIVPAIHRARAKRRGVAVLLALVAVSVATLLGLSLASSRDASVATSSNLSKVATVRAAAASGLDLANSILAKEDALAALDGAELFTKVLINGASVRAEVRDLETNRPATVESAAIEVIVYADADGVAQVARAVGRMPATDAPLRADLDCSEFALLGTGSISVLDDAHVGVWSASPLAVLGEPVRYGLASGSSSGLTVGHNASVHGCVAVRQGAFTQGSEEFEQSLADKLCPIPAPIHVPGAPIPLTSETTVAQPSLMLDGLVSHNASSSGDARVPARGSLTLRGTVTLDVGGNFFVERGARMFVEGAAVLVVRGNAVVDAGTVEVAPLGSLTIVAQGDLTLGTSFVGGARTNPSEVRDATGAASYDGGAARVMIYAGAESRVLVADGTVIKGQIYAPDARIDVESRSAIYGRILGKQVVLHEGVGLFYDPTLDARRGWSNRASGIWTETGVVQEAVRAITTLDDAALLDFAVKSGVEPDPPSIAEAAVVLVNESFTAQDFDERADDRASDRVRAQRKLLKSRLMQRVEALKRFHEQAVLTPIEGSGAGLTSQGFEWSREGDD